MAEHVVPTILARYNPPKATHVTGFSFPVYCVRRECRYDRGIRHKHVFVSWIPQKTKSGQYSSAIIGKEWESFSWLPKKLKNTVAQSIESMVVATDEDIMKFAREQRALWSEAFQNRVRRTRQFDVQRKARIAQVCACVYLILYYNM